MLKFGQAATGWHIPTANTSPYFVQTAHPVPQLNDDNGARSHDWSLNVVALSPGLIAHKPHDLTLILYLSLQALKDSLGGNCRTTMVATISSEQQQVDESISTCRFAERVAMVRNMVSRRTGGVTCYFPLPFLSLHAYACHAIHTAITETSALCVQVAVNEEVDPTLVIRRLKLEIRYF